jgi:hypothetical protein
MPRFTTAPVKDVAPQRRQRQPSQRAQTQQQYQEAVRSALIDRNEALIVEFDPEDKPLTIRNRVKRAIESLDLQDVTIRRRGNRIVAYRLEPGEGEQLEIPQLEEAGV